MNFSVISNVLESMIRIATPLILMSLGGILCQRSGIFNIALEGFALVGAFFGITFVHFSGGNVYVGFLAAMFFGMLYSCIFAIFTIKFKANNIIASIAMNMLATGLTSYLLRVMFDVQGRFAPNNIVKISMIELPIIKHIPLLNVLSKQSIITYIALIMVFVVFLLLFKTKAGLEMCAVGESTSASKAAGVNIALVQCKAVLFSGIMCGLAGAYLSTVIVSQFSENMIQGRGFTAFTALVFGAAHPLWTFLVSLLFGLADAIDIRIELIGLHISPSIIKIFPLLFALLALSISSYIDKLKTKGVFLSKKMK